MVNKFTDTLKIEYYGKIDKKDYWQVHSSFSYYLQKDHTHIITIPKGFLTDGASVPRPFWSLLPPWGDYGQAAVLHDYLIDFGKVEIVKDDVVIDHYYVNRHEARYIFDNAMSILKVNRFKRLLIKNAVMIYDYYAIAKKKLLKRA